MIPKVASGAVSAASVAELLKILGIGDFLSEARSKKKASLTSGLFGSGQNQAPLGISGSAPTAGYQPKQTVTINKPSGEKITVKTEGGSSGGALDNAKNAIDDVTGGGSEKPGPGRFGWMKGKAGKVASVLGGVGLIAGLISMLRNNGSEDEMQRMMMMQMMGGGGKGEDDETKQLKNMLLMAKLAQMQGQGGGGGSMFGNFPSGV